MNVLYIVGGEGNRYGSEIIAIDLISVGKQNGVNYTVVTANKGAVSETCKELGIPCYVVPFTFFVYKAMSNKLLNFVKKTVWKTRAEFLTWRAARRIEKMVDLKSINLIHTNLSRDLLGGKLAEKYGIPHVWHIHELFKAHYQLSFLRKNQIEWMGQHADSFLAISQTVANEWMEAGIPKEKMCVAYNGINLNDIIPKDSYSTQEGLKLVMVGHIVPPKGQEKVIRYLASLPEDVRKNTTFDCFGEGTEEYKYRLVQLAKEGGVNLNLKGYCSEVGKVLKDYDVGINCSRGEGFGLSTVECMAAGLCPLVSDTGANEELIEHQKTGFVFSYQSEQDFPKMIEYLYAHRDEMEAVAKNARELASARYNVETMQKTIFDHYQSVAKK